ncbi:hypothetical protein [Amycolatopsis sp. CA-230715]|uniref:hypothetical protein n=1 Tax=Amycolatopsis sp. CA-230715 TaxID=2745196 RepID=UPI001C0353BB|nr:hypothetical protein [Amycolatopsis sp. CA-230715]
MAYRNHGRRSRLVLNDPPPSGKAGPARVNDALHAYRVELSLEASGLMFVALVHAPHPDVAARNAGRRIAEVIKEGHFITKIDVSLVDDESSLPAQRREESSC